MIGDEFKLLEVSRINLPFRCDIKLDDYEPDCLIAEFDVTFKIDLFTKATNSIPKSLMIDESLSCISVLTLDQDDKNLLQIDYLSYGSQQNVSSMIVTSQMESDLRESLESSLQMINKRSLNDVLSYNLINRRTML